MTVVFLKGEQNMSYEYWGHLFDVNGKCVDCGLSADGREPDIFCTKEGRKTDQHEDDSKEYLKDIQEEDEFFKNYVF